MTSITGKISKELEIIYQGNSWHGPNIKNILESLDDRSLDFQLNGSHTIRELLLHMLSWRKIVMLRLLFQSEPSEKELKRMNFPDNKYSIDHIRKEFAASQDQLTEIMLHFPETRLHDPIPGKEHSYLETMQGLLNHDLYHIGQVVLMRNYL